MSFPVACGCGQKFMAPDHLSGKEVPCPACGEPLLIQPSPVAAVADPPKPSPPRPAANPHTAASGGSAATAKPAASALQIAVRCGCGKAYKAPAALRGKTLKCPACGQDMPIPLSAPKAVPSPATASVTSDPFGADTSEVGGDLFGADPFAGAPLGNDPLGGDLFGAPLASVPLGGPLAMPMAGAPQTAHAQVAYGAPHAKEDDGGGNTKLLVFLGVSVGIALLGLAIGIWLVNRNSGGAPVATPTPTVPPATTPAATIPTPTVAATSTLAAATQASAGGNPMGPMSPVSPMTPMGLGAANGAGTVGNPMGPGSAGPGSPQDGPMPGVALDSNGASESGVPAAEGAPGSPNGESPMPPMDAGPMGPMPSF